MTALADLKTRIADEIDRTDSTSQIALAVTSAVKSYKFRRFAFNESSDTFATVSGTATYGSGTIPSDMLQIDAASILVNSNAYQLRPVTFQVLDQLSTQSTLTGYPTLYAWHAEQIRLYPIPNGAYTITLYYLADVDEETWATRAEALIRCRAKKELYAHFLFDYEKAAAIERMEVGELRELMREAQHKQASGRVRAWD